VTPVKHAKTCLMAPTVDLAVKIIAIVSLLLGLAVGIGQYRLSTCLAHYNDAQSAATAQRADANADTNAAIDKVIRAIANASQLPVDQRQMAVAVAFQEYIKSRATADEQRKLNPNPAPPSESC
jgi:hypothetical protein